MKPISLSVFVMLLVAPILCSGQSAAPHSNAPVLVQGRPEDLIKADPLGQEMQRAVLEKQDLKEIQRIIKAGFKIDDPIGCGTFNGVDGAVAIGNVKILKFFLANGAQPKGSALLQAVWCRKPEVSFQMVEALLKAGATANYKEYYPKEWVTGDTRGSDTNRFNSPLHIACYQGYFEVAKLLLSHPGVELNGRNIDGYTPLMRAAAKGDEKIVGLLLAKGANVNVKNGRGETAAEVARKRYEDRTKILQMLANAPTVTIPGATNQTSLRR